jgi:RNA polymerase sigma factor (sigma-70 family)
MSTKHMGKVIQSLRRAASRQDVAGLGDSELLGRYIAGGDEAAFEALVRRHGTMVLAVCNRVLKNCHDAEDAFQATFLVLVRKAASIVKRETVGGWLYGVAYKTALKARMGNSERRTKEIRAGSMRKEEVVGEDAWAEMRPLIDQELNRLPDKYRVLILLCDLGGKTRKEAASQLGWPEGTVSGRLARARTLLAKRLARHGLPLGGVTAALSVSQNTALAASPAILAASTVKSAMAFAARQTSAGAISVKAAALAEGVLKAMLMSKLKWAAVVLVLMLAGGYGALTYSAAAGQGAGSHEDPAPKPEASPANPPQAEVKLTKAEKALQDLGKVYKLADGEDLKCFRAPFLPERKAYGILQVGPGAERLYDGYVIQAWRWNGEKLQYPWVEAHNDGGNASVIDVIPQLTGVRRCEMEGDGLALVEARQIRADFVIREGATQQRIIQQLGVILRGDLKTPVKLNYKEVEREVLVASGTFKTEAPLGDMQGTPLQLFGTLPIRKGKGLKSGSSDYRGMLDQIALLTGRQVINEVKDSQAHGRTWYEWDPADHLDVKDDMKTLLDRVTAQTGLTFKQEKRRVKVLFVEQTE